MKKTTFLLSLMFLCAANILAQGEGKKSESTSTPLTPIQTTPLQRIIPLANDPKHAAIYSATFVDVPASGSSGKATLKIVVSVEASRPARVFGTDSEVWMIVSYAALLSEPNPSLSLGDYVLDTTGVTVTDGEGKTLGRVSLASIVNTILDSATSNRQTFVPATAPPPPVGSSSTFYIDCNGGFTTNTVTCLGTENNNAGFLYGSQQAGYAMGTAIRAWRVKHHNQTIQNQARQALVFWQDSYLRERLTFMGSEFAQPKASVRNGTVVYRRADGLKASQPIYRAHSSERKLRVSQLTSARQRA